MSIEKKVLLNMLAVDKDDNIILLLSKSLIEGVDTEIAQSLHRVLIPAGADVEHYLAANSESLIQMGYPPIPENVKDRVRRVKQFADALPPVDKAKVRGS